jgi:hypothetical protein
MMNVMNVVDVVVEQAAGRRRSAHANFLHFVDEVKFFFAKTG